MAGEGKVVRMAYDFLSQANREGKELAGEMGLQMMDLFLNNDTPIAIFVAPFMLLMLAAAKVWLGDTR